MTEPAPFPMPSAGGTYVRLPDGSLITLEDYEATAAAVAASDPAPSAAEPAPKPRKPAVKE